MALFSDESYNKSTSNGFGTLIGNWQEEQILNKDVGDRRSKAATNAAQHAATAAYGDLDSTQLNNATAHRNLGRDYTFDRVLTRKFDVPSTTYSDYGSTSGKEFFRQARYQPSMGPREAIVSAAIWEEAKEEIKKENEEFQASIRPDYRSLESTQQGTHNPYALVVDQSREHIHRPAGMTTLRSAEHPQGPRLNANCMRSTGQWATQTSSQAPWMTNRAEVFEPRPMFPPARGVEGRVKHDLASQGAHTDDRAQKMEALVGKAVVSCFAPATAELLGPYSVTVGLSATLSELKSRNGATGVTGDAEVRGFGRDAKFSTPVNLQMGCPNKDWRETQEFSKRNTLAAAGNLMTSVGAVSTAHNMNPFRLAPGSRSAAETPLHKLKNEVAAALRTAFGIFGYSELRRFLRSVAGIDGSVAVAEVKDWLRGQARLDAQKVPEGLLDAALKAECRQHKDKANWHALLLVLRHELPERRRDIVGSFITDLLLSSGVLPNDTPAYKVAALLLPLGVLRSVFGKNSLFWEALETSSADDLRAAERRCQQAGKNDEEVLVTPALVVEAFRDISASAGVEFEKDDEFFRAFPGQN